MRRPDYNRRVVVTGLGVVSPVGNDLDTAWSNLVEGVSAGIRDALHAYEEGQGCISYRLLMDYGNPTAVERVMTACSHYGQWMKKADDGKYDFLSNYFGAKGVWTQGEFGVDKGVTGLMFVQAGLLLWYNHHPAVAEYLLNWRRTPDRKSTRLNSSHRT